MLHTLITIAFVSVGLTGGFLGWSQYVQRGQSPGRHRATDQKTRPRAAA